MLNQYTYLRVKSDRQLTKIKFCFYLYYHSLEGWLSVLFSTSQRQSINTLITLQINYFLSSWKRWKKSVWIKRTLIFFFFLSIASYFLKVTQKNVLIIEYDKGNKKYAKDSRITSHHLQVYKSYILHFNKPGCLGHWFHVTWLRLLFKNR